jgi:hypothetical protein
MAMQCFTKIGEIVSLANGFLRSRFGAGTNGWFGWLNGKLGIGVSARQHRSQWAPSSSHFFLEPTPAHRRNTLVRPESVARRTLRPSAGRAGCGAPASQALAGRVGGSFPHMLAAWLVPGSFLLGPMQRFVRNPPNSMRASWHEFIPISEAIRKLLT